MATIKKTSIRTSDVQKPERLADKLKTTPEALAELEELANDPQYSTGAPPDSQQSLQQAIQSARELYDRETNKNDWLEVAQTLGRAVTQFAGAQAGMSSGGRFGSNMANLNMGPGIDYEGRNARAQRQYGQSVGDARDLANAARQSHLDTETSKAREYDRISEPKKLGLKAAMERDAEEARFAKAQKAELTREEREDTRAARQGSNELIKENTREMNELARKIRAGQSLANQLQQEDDLSKKNLESLQVKYGALAGQADVNLADVVDQYEKSAPRQEPEGITGKVRDFLGIKQPIDKPAAHKSLLDVMGTNEKIKRALELRKQNRALAGEKQAPQSQEEAAPAEQQQQESQTVRVKFKGQLLEIPRSDLDQALKDGAELAQ